jgi:Flp pilus assembly protein TadG
MPLSSPAQSSRPAGLATMPQWAAMAWRRLRSTGPRLDSAAGSATVELAAAIPLLIAVTFGMIGLIGVARDQVLVQGAAREGAREAALSGDPGRAMAATRAALPAGRPAAVHVTAPSGGRVRVEVELPARLLPTLPPVRVRASAVAAVEPGPPPAPSGP